MLGSMWDDVAEMIRNDGGTMASGTNQPQTSANGDWYQPQMDTGNHLFWEPEEDAVCTTKRLHMCNNYFSD